MTDALPGPLVSAGWLGAALGRPGLVVLDATYFLAPEGRDAGAEFLAGHVPGARRFDIDAVADDETGLPHMVPSAGRFSRLVGALGVGDASDVVFYDIKGLFSAARGWWLMRLFGHDRAAVLDGGLPAWRAAGLPVAAGEPAAAVPATFTPAFRAGLLRGLGDMVSNLESGAELVVDARPAARFSGAAPEPRPGLRRGHIPGAVSLPFTDVLTADGHLRPAAELRAAFAQTGARERPVVTSCGSGLTAAVLTLARVVAGLPAGALYDGAWAEWGARADLPAEI